MEREKYDLKGTLIPDSKRFLDALISNTTYCKIAKQHCKHQLNNKLLDWLIAYRFSELNENELPTFKEIHQLTGIPYRDIAPGLQDIYSAICKLNVTHPREFKFRDQRMTILKFSFFDVYAEFYIGLDEVPRAGDEFVFKFVKPKTGLEKFWIKKVRHEVFDGGQLISIYLTGEQPNLYKQLLIEKAYMNGELNQREYLGNLEEETKEKLLELYKNL